MTTDPRTSEDIYRSLRNSLTGKIAALTNFTQNSFNYIWTRAFADEVREAELRTIAAELSGLIDYSGKELTQDDLDDLNIDDSVDPEEINQYMQEQHLDEYVKVLGISRFEGSRATGKVDIQTQSPGVITIPNGTIVTTSPDSDGNTLRFEVVETVETGDGESEVEDVDIRAVDVGEEYEVSTGSITRFEEPPVGVTGIEQLSDTNGGEKRESTEELRARAKQAVPSSSDGGTVAGIKGKIRSDVEAVGEGDVVVDEFTGGSRNYVDVIVDGGSDNVIKGAIEEGRPVGIQHNLVRPQTIQLGVDVDLLGQDIDIEDVESAIEEILLDFGLGENFYDDILVKEILDADDGIQNIDKQFVYVAKVQNEKFIFNPDNSSPAQSEYRLDFTYADNNSFEISAEETEINNSDYSIEDRSGDGYKETIVFSENLNDGEEFSVNYDVTDKPNTSQYNWYRLDLVRDEVFVWNKNYTESFDYSDGEDIYELDYVPFRSSISISDNSGDTYTRGVDFVVFDESGDGFKQKIKWKKLGATTLDDSGTFTDFTSEANNKADDDVELLPPDGDVGTGDAFYIGQSSEFESVETDITTAGAGTWTIVWEYWDGSSWTTLSNVTDNTSGFQNSGKNTVSWDVPNDWADTSVNDTSLKWVRARVDSFSSMSTQPLAAQISPDSPDDTEEFTVEYTQKVYKTEYDITGTTDEEITDNSGDNYTEGSDYQIADYQSSGEFNAIEWLKKPTNISDDEKFYFTYETEGDRNVTDREKISPANVSMHLDVSEI